MSNYKAFSRINGKIWQWIADGLTANTGLNTNIAERIGNLEDDPVGSPSDTASIVAMLKGSLGASSPWILGTEDTTPLGNTLDLWSTDGPVVITGLFGVVHTTPIQAQATNVKISFDPDDGGGNVDLCANVDAVSSATGSIIRLTGDISDAAIISLDVAEAPGFDFKKGIILSQPGSIFVTYGATSVGEINWYVKFESVDGSVLIKAA